MDDLLKTIKECYNKLESHRDIIEAYELHPYTMQLYEFLLQDLVEFYTNIQEDLNLLKHGEN